MSLEGGLRGFADRDYTAAFKQLEPLAERGDAVAQRTLGHMYYDPTPDWVDADHTTAARWYARAAEQGDMEAQYALAVLYIHHEGQLRRPGGAKRVFAHWRHQYVPTYETEAYKWLYLAAKQGHKDAGKRWRQLKETLTPVQLTQLREVMGQWRAQREGDAEEGGALNTRLSRRDIRNL